MSPARHDELLSLTCQWAEHFGYYDGQIDPNDGADLEAFVTSDCALTVHAPLWGTRRGQERAVPVADVRTQLARMLRWVRIARHHLHLARHPHLDAICLFFVVKVRFSVLPIPLMTVPLAFVVSAQRTPRGLKIASIHEWPAGSPEDARRVLIAQCGWPEATAFTPYEGLGTIS